MKLKPCPFCGNAPRLEYNDTIGFFVNGRYFRYACCGIAGEPSEYTYEAAEAWNRRAGEGGEEVKNELTCDLNYEAEYERIDAICKKQYMEIEAMKSELESREKELRELRARLDMVFLIFGGRNHG